VLTANNAITINSKHISALNFDSLPPRFMFPMVLNRLPGYNEKVILALWKIDIKVIFSVAGTVPR